MKTVLLTSVAVLMLALTGCGTALIIAVPSFSHKVVSGTRIRTGDLSFVRLGETSRDQISNRFGAPWTNYLDLHITVYYWESVSWYVGNTNGGEDNATRLDVLFILFDDEERVRKYKIMKNPWHTATKDLAAQWASSK